MAQIAKTVFVASGAEACAHHEIEVVVEATGVPAAGIAHARAAMRAKKHIVNVEADVLAGPLPAEEARAAGVVYSLAYGDQPALVCEQVDWARACGFESPPPAKGRNICRPITRSRRMTFGRITA
jgi:predicted homoserine dehydrogenase-like protein